MATIILVHGAWHGSWCWERVIPHLKAAHFLVRAPDLPGHGQDKTPIREVTLQAYVDKICEVIDSAQPPVMLVGHSLGGMVITQAAESRPDKIDLLVYVCAFLLENGQSRHDGAPVDPQSIMGPRVLNKSADGSYTTIKPSALKDLFYGDCTDEDVALVQARIGPQAAAPPATRLKTSDENFGRVRRIYIETLQDRAMTPNMQRAMYTALPCEKVIAMNTSHSPFWSQPKELAQHLLGLAGGSSSD
ncbi:MAG: alpha/beta fold hydrolase [bacterium]